MRRGLIDRNYLYEREGHHCFHCGKALRRDQVSVDHYLPKSAGGTNDLFNVVCSCRKCNRYKKSAIPGDWQGVQLKLFRKLIEDHKIGAVDDTINWMEMENDTRELRNIFQKGAYVVIESSAKRFYVKQGRIWYIEDVVK